MQDIDILYLFEKAARELDVACVVKYLAQKRHGLHVEIIQQNYGYPQAFEKYRPRMVILPFCYQERSNNVYFVKWRKAIYFNLSWEQLFYPGNRKAKTPRGEFAVHHVLHHAWSDFYADLLRRQGVPEDHIFVNGNLSLALYEEPYKRYFKPRVALAAQYGLDADKKWVFFPENFNWAFYSEAMLRQMIDDGQAPDQVFSLREFSRRSFEIVIRWCRELAAGEGVELIIRPRPATVVGDFMAKVHKITSTLPTSMRILQDETVREWVMASDMVISSYSTTLIEAAIAGKPIFMLEPDPFPESLRQEWHHCIPHLKTESQFMDACLKSPDYSGTNRLGDWARGTMMAHGDPILTLVDRLAGILRGDTAVPAVPSRKIVTLPSRYPLPKRLYYELVRLVLAFTKPISIDRVHPEYRDDVLSQESIGPRVERWGQIIEAKARVH